MTRPSIPATTAGGDAVTLEATSEGAGRHGNHGRLLAQLEHNAMLALGLVRAAMLALQAVTRASERATHLLAGHHGVLDPVVARELRRVFDELGQHVQSAAHDGHALLNGTRVAFALDDPWRAASELLRIELPDLSSVLAPHGLRELGLGAHTTVLPVLQQLNTLRIAVQQGQGSLQRATQQLDVVLERLHADRAEPARQPGDDFEQLAVRVRDHVLRSGAAALRVQGEPSTRAAWLVEGFEESV